MLPEFRQVSTEEALRRLMGTIQETTEEFRPPPPFEEKNIICVYGNRTLCVRVQSTLSVFLLDAASVDRLQRAALTDALESNDADYPPARVP